jgi:hypothetical protein
VLCIAWYFVLRHYDTGPGSDAYKRVHRTLFTMNIALLLLSSVTIMYLFHGFASDGLVPLILTVLLSMFSLKLGFRFSTVISLDAGMLALFAVLTILARDSLFFVLLVLASCAIYAISAFYNERFIRHDFLVQRKQMHEKSRATSFASQMLPVEIAQRIGNISDGFVADFIGDVDVLFSDIVSFTTLCGRIDSIEVVAILNVMFNCFDELSDEYHVYKVEVRLLLLLLLLLLLCVALLVSLLLFCVLLLLPCRKCSPLLLF